MPANPLTPEQKRDAERLNAIYGEHKSAHKLTQAALADDLGFAGQSAVSQYLKGRIPLNVNVAVKFAKRFGCEVSHFSPSLQREIDRLAGFTSTDDGTLKTYKASEPESPTYFSRGDKNVGSGPDITRKVPLVSWEVPVGVRIPAGRRTKITENAYANNVLEWIPYPRGSGEQVIAFRVEGDSMTAPSGKSYPAGSIIFADLARRSPVSGERVIATISGAPKATFKVFKEEDGRRWLMALNPDKKAYPAITDEFLVIGTVVGKWEDE